MRFSLCQAIHGVTKYPSDPPVCLLAAASQANVGGNVNINAALQRNIADIVNIGGRGGKFVSRGLAYQDLASRCRHVSNLV